MRNNDTARAKHLSRHHNLLSILTPSPSKLSLYSLHYTLLTIPFHQSAFPKKLSYSTHDTILQCLIFFTSHIKKEKEKEKTLLCGSQALRAETAGGVGLSPCDMYVIGYRCCVKFDVSEEVKKKENQVSDREREKE